MGYVILGILAVLVIYTIYLYNDLVKHKKTVDNAWSRVDVQLQRRFDLIPNILEAVKGYMNYESETLEKVTKLRMAWNNSTSMKEKEELDKQLESTLQTVFAVSEGYPELKSSENFERLQEELRATENMVAASRQFYNDSVTRYNIKLQVVPSNIIADFFKFEPAELFMAESEEARKNINIEF